MDYYDRMPYFLRTLISLVLAGWVSAQAQVAAPAEPAGKKSALDSALFHQLLLSELNARADEPAAAFALMLDAARKTRDAALFRRAVQIALQARSGESALLAANAWTEALPNDQEASRYVLQILLGLNRPSETLTPLKRFLALTPIKDRPDILWMLPALYERTSDKSATAVLQKALTPMLRDPVLGASAWASLGRLSLANGDRAAALDAATQGQALGAQHEHPAWLALSLMRSDEPRAEALVKQHLASGASADFRLAHLQKLLAANRQQESLGALTTLTEQQPEFAPAWLMRGLLSAQANEWDQAEVFLKRYLALKAPQATGARQTDRGPSQAYLSLAQIAAQRKQPEQALQWLQRVDHPDDLIPAQLKRASLIAQQGKLDDALALIHALPEFSQADSRLKRMAEIQVLREHKKFAQVRELLTAALQESPQDTDLMYELAMTTEKMGDLAETERLLRQVIELKPEDPHAYNALGYSLADRKLRLTEARQLIEQALALTPEDPFITDSLGWVAFRQGHHDEAIRLLRKAFAKKPDAEIAAHLGEVLWISHQRDEALKVWREGRQLNPDNETLTETLQRLQIRL